MWDWFINFLTAVLAGIEGFVGDWGLAVIILTVIIRLILTPLMAHSTKSTARMQVMQPKLQEIQERYADNPERQAEELRKVYAEMKFNPLGGCLPIFLQMPVFFGLFTVAKQVPADASFFGILPSISLSVSQVIEASGWMAAAPYILFDVLFAGMPETKQCPWPDPKYPGKQCCTAKALGLYWFPEKALFTEYRQFTLGDGHDLADFDTYLDPKIRGLTWPVVNGKPTTYRFNAEYDPYVKNGDFEFYGKLMKAIPQGNLDGITDKTPKPLPGRAKIFFRPFAEPVEKPDANYDLMLCTGRILEHWHTGSMTRRVPELHRAAPSAVLYMHPTDAQKRGLKRNDVAQITSRRGSIKALVETQGRMKMPRGTVWMAFFDESVQVNKLCIDATDPISAEPDFKKSAVRVTKA